MIEIQGKVIHGQHYGTQIGFPTANIDRRDYVRRKLKVKLGVWAGYVQIPNNKFQITNKSQVSKSKNPKPYKAGIVIGPRDNKFLPKIEAHLLNFKGNLYGKKITITLQKYLRAFKKFKSEQQLKKQIKEDIRKIKQAAK